MNTVKSFRLKANIWCRKVIPNKRYLKEKLLWKTLIWGTYLQRKSPNPFYHLLLCCQCAQGSSAKNFLFKVSSCYFKIFFLQCTMVQLKNVSFSALLSSTPIELGPFCPWKRWSITFHKCDDKMTKHFFLTLGSVRFHRFPSWYNLSLDDHQIPLDQAQLNQSTALNFELNNWLWHIY